MGNQDAQGRALSWGDTGRGSLVRTQVTSTRQERGRRRGQQRGQLLFTKCLPPARTRLGAWGQYLTRSLPKRERRLRSHCQVESHVGAHALPAAAPRAGGHGVQGEETLVILASLGAWPTSRQGPRGLVSALLRVEEGELQWQGQRPHGRAKWLLFHPRLPGRPRAPSGRRCPRAGEGLGPRVIQRRT